MASRDSSSGFGLESGALSSLVRLSRYPWSDVVVVVDRRDGDGATNAVTPLLEEQMVAAAAAPSESERVACIDRCMAVYL